MEPVTASQHAFHTLERLPHATYVLGSDRRIRHANHEFARLLGYPPGQLAGRVGRELLQRDDAERLEAGFAEARAGRPVQCDLRIAYRHRDGAWIVMETAARFAPDEKGAILAFVSLRPAAAAASGERRAVIREAHHLIKSGIQGIAGLLLEHAQDHPSCREPLNRAIERIRSVELVHGLCAAPGTEFPDLCDVSLRIVEAMQRHHGRKIVTLASCDARPAFIDSHELVPYALILTEIISNAMKHGGSPRAPVGVQIQRVDAGAAVSVISAGARLPAGFDLQRGIGLGTGLSLARSLLPPRGLDLSIFQRERDVAARIRLGAPVVTFHAGAAGSVQ